MVVGWMAEVIWKGLHLMGGGGADGGSFYTFDMGGGTFDVSVVRAGSKSTDSEGIYAGLGVNFILNVSLHKAENIPQ